MNLTTRPTKLHLALLLISGLIAIGIGASILWTPVQFHAANGIQLGDDASLLSEIRAPGGALLALGFLMLVGTFSRSFLTASTSIAAVVFLAYGASRLFSIALDGAPGSGLIGAMVIELVIGSACTALLLRPKGRVEVTVAPAREGHA